MLFENTNVIFATQGFPEQGATFEAESAGTDDRTDGADAADVADMLACFESSEFFAQLIKPTKVMENPKLIARKTIL